MAAPTTSIQGAFDPSILSDPVGHEGMDMDGLGEEGTLPNQTTQGVASPPADDGDLGDLFGDDDGAESTKDEERQSSATPSLRGSDADGLTPAERRKRKAMEYEEEDGGEEPQVVELSEAYVPIPNLPLPRSSDGNHWIIRMPNFINVEPHPFDQDTYQGPGADDDVAEGLSNREKSMTIKLEVENTIRWRWVKGPNDAEPRKQSNSRVIRWSDGSMSLQLGEELFDISANIDLPTSAAPRMLPQAAGSQQEFQSANALTRNQGLTYLFAQHERAEILQAEAAITGTLSLTPTGMQSGIHRKLVKAVGQKHNKVTRLMMAPDPTKESELERTEQLKATKKASTFKRRKTAGEAAPRRRSAASRAPKKSHNTDWSDEDEASEDDDEPFNTRRMGKAVPESAKKRPGAGDYEKDEFLVEDDEDEKRNGDDADSLEEAEEAIERAELLTRKKEKKKPRKRDDSDEESEADPDAMADSDAENEVAVRPAVGRKTRRIAPVDSDEDEE